MVGELSALAKTGKLAKTVSLTKNISKLSKVVSSGAIKILKKSPKLAGLLKKLPKTIVTEVQKIGFKSYLILKVKTTTLAKISDEAVFSEMKLLQEGAIVKYTDGSDIVFTNAKYIDNGVEQTGTLSIVKNGDEVGVKVVNAGINFNFSTIKNLTGIIPTGKRLTNINFSQFTKGFDASFINNLGAKYADDLLKVKQGLDKGGNLTEGIVSQALRNDGYTVIDDLGKYGSNNGFDVVAFKGTLDNPSEIVIVEAKQFKQRKVAEFDNISNTPGYDPPSGLTLNPNNQNTGLPTQMSDDWVFEHVFEKLIDGTNNQFKLATAMTDRSKVSKFVFAIDKSTGNGYFTKLSSF